MGVMVSGCGRAASCSDPRGADQVGRNWEMEPPEMGWARLGVSYEPHARLAKQEQLTGAD